MKKLFLFLIVAMILSSFKKDDSEQPANIFLLLPSGPPRMISLSLSMVEHVQHRLNLQLIKPG
jgi:hypothetical protein